MATLLPTVIIIRPKMSSHNKLFIIFLVIWVGTVSPEEVINTEPLQPDDNINLESQFIASVTNKLPVEKELLSEQAVDPNDIEAANISNVTDDSDARNVTREIKKIVNCRPNLINATAEERTATMVEMVNSSRLVDLLLSDVEITTKETEANCMVVFFYSRLCPFSAMAGPHFNGFARSFPDIKMVALDALKYHGVNTQYGIVGVPTLILFHNGRPIAKFNGTEYTVHAFVKFIKIYTGLQEDVIIVHSQDFQGPVPSVIDKEIDYFLILSWTFIIACCIYFVSISSWWKLLVEMIQNNWRESTGQHEHVE